MDNIAIELGAEGPETIGDTVTLFGTDGTARILVEEWAAAAETINYEIATGIGGRVVTQCVGEE